MDDSMKEAVRALARFFVTGTAGDPSLLKALKGFRLVGEIEHLIELRQFLKEAGADEQGMDRACEILQAADDKASSHDENIVGRTDEQLKLDGRKTLEPLERQVLAVFVLSAWEKLARADEEFKTEVIEAPQGTPKPTIDLNAVPVVTPGGTKKAKKATAASAAGTSTIAAASATTTAAAGTPLPTPAPAAGNRVAELETEVADLKAKLAERDALIVRIQADLAKTSNERNQLALYRSGMRDRPAFAGPELHAAPAAPHAPATHAPVPDPHQHGTHDSHAPVHAPADVAEVRTWNVLFPSLLASLHLVSGRHGRELDAELVTLRTRQETFRRRGGAAYQRGVEVIDAFLKGQFTDTAAFKARFQELS